MALITGCTTISRALNVKVFPDFLSNFFVRIVKDNIDYREKHSVKRNDFMDILMALQKEDRSLTANEITAQAFVFFLAGFDTSSATMTCCLYELSQQPDVQRTVRQNVRDVLERHDNRLTYEAMLEMNVLDQAINGKWLHGRLFRARY